MRPLAALSALFGLVCMAIAATHIALGLAAIPGGVVTNAVMDSEDRFYATLFLGFGAAMVWCAGDLARRGGTFGALLLVFFLGGIARLVSVAAVGLPSPLFVALGAVELILPPIFWTWRRAVAR